MSQKAIAEQVLTAALDKIGRDVGELLGQPLSCGDVRCALLDKGAYFSDLPPPTEERVIGLPLPPDVRQGAQ